MQHNVVKDFVTTIALRDRSARRVSEASDIVRAIEAYLQTRSTALGENHVVPPDEIEDAIQRYNTVRGASASRARAYQQSLLDSLFQGVKRGRSSRF